jgi:hypothetical protein
MCFHYLLANGVAIAVHCIVVLIPPMQIKAGYESVTGAEVGRGAIEG